MYLNQTPRRICSSFHWKCSIRLLSTAHTHTYSHVHRQIKRLLCECSGDARAYYVHYSLWWNVIEFTWMKNHRYYCRLQWTAWQKPYSAHSMHILTIINWKLQIEFKMLNTYDPFWLNVDFKLENWTKIIIAFTWHNRMMTIGIFCFVFFFLFAEFYSLYAALQVTNSIPASFTNGNKTQNCFLLRAHFSTKKSTGKKVKQKIGEFSQFVKLI